MGLLCTDGTITCIHINILGAVQNQWQLCHNVDYHENEFQLLFFKKKSWLL